MTTKETKRKRVLEVLAAVATVVGMLILLALICFGMFASTSLEQDVTMRPEAEIAAGMPLDATFYNAPTFAEGDYSLRVVDRQTGDKWWLVKFGGEWVVLPLDRE